MNKPAMDRSKRVFQPAENRRGWEVFYLVETINHLKIEPKLAEQCSANFGSILNCFHVSIRKNLSAFPMASARKTGLSKKRHFERSLTKKVMVEHDRNFISSKTL